MSQRLGLSTVVVHLYNIQWQLLGNSRTQSRVWRPVVENKKEKKTI